MIKTILFDFGDVFINLDKEATFKELFDLGVEEVTMEMIAKTFDYEVGAINSQELIEAFQDMYPAISSEDFIKAWNAILLDFPEHRLAFLKELAQKKDYTLLLLSNTNAMHIDWVQKNWGMEKFLEFKGCFDGFYLSHEINMRKPNPDPFEYILGKHECNPNEVLFVDDTLEHIETARKLGVQTWHLQVGKEDVTQLFSQPVFNI